MAMFLTRQSLYRLIQRELPEDVYPDAGDPSKFWSTADSDSEAQVLANAYARLNQTWNNFWPQTADADGIAQHEILRFGSIADDLSLADRQARVVARVRALPSLNAVDLLAIVAAELPEGTNLEIVKWNAISDGGTWYIGESELGAGTILGGYGALFYPLGTDLCLKDGSDVGLTSDQWAELRRNAYTYELRIYEYTPTADELAAVERELTLAEWSAAVHYTRTNVDVSEVVDRYLPVMSVFDPYLPTLEEP